MVEETKKFEIPMNFSELVFRAIFDIDQPQTSHEYNYRVSRLDEILKPFRDEEFNQACKQTKENFFKNIDKEKFRTDLSYSIPATFELERRIFPLLVALCQRIGVIDFKPTQEPKKVIE